MAGSPQTPGAHGGSAPAVRLLDEHDRRVVMLNADAAAGEAAGDSALARTLIRARRWSRATRALAVALIALGTLALADATVTLVWQEPLSALYARLRQNHLAGVLRTEEGALPSPVERRALSSLTSSPARIAFLAASLQRRAADGIPVGRIRIPSLHANFVVVNGTSTSALESGPGVLPETVFPGRGGTTAIAGHRTTYLQPFRHIDELRRGNSITLDMPYAHFTYRVTASRIVSPYDVHAAVDYVGYPRLVLSACTPLFSAAKRILVFARLERTTPVRAARSPAGGLGHAGSSPRRHGFTSGARSRSARPPLHAHRAAIPPASP